MAESQCIVNLGQYEVNMLDKLGQGAFGVVYKGTDTKHGLQIAAKQVELRDNPDGVDALTEIKALNKVPSHENIIKLLDFQYHGRSVWIIMEFCECGDLQCYFGSYAPVPDATKIEFMLQMSAAVDHMHSLPQPVTHRDLKPQNIMLRYGPDNNRPVVKVTDFGLSKSADSGLGKTYMMETVAGTPCFMAPEQFARESYTSSVDIFAMGLIFLGMLNFDEVGDISPIYKEDMDIGMALPPGLLLVNAAKAGLKLPALVKERPSDGILVEKVKQVIDKMVCFNNRDRSSSHEVKQMLQTIFSQISNLPPPPARPKAAYIKTQDRHVIKADERTETSEPDEDLDALSRKVAERMHREELERAFGGQRSERGIRIALEDSGSLDLMKELLKHIQGDDDDDEDDSDATKFQKGDHVLVDSDEQKVIQLQENHGGWNKRMKHYLGVKGKVESKSRRNVQVRFGDGAGWSYNPKVLKKLENSTEGEEEDEGLEELHRALRSRANDTVNGLFNKYDIIKLPDEEEVVKLLQSGHGGWNEKLKLCLGVRGLVSNIDAHGDVKVEFINGEKWTLNPELLIKVEKEELEGADLECGDFVLVRNVTEHEARALQENHGGWASGMESTLGHTGVVKALLPGSKVKVEVSKNTWIYNKNLITLVERKDEVVRVLLRRQFAM